MNMTGKTIEVTHLSTSTLEQKTEATVQVMEDLGGGVMRSVGTFKLSFDTSYNAIDDGRLIPDIIAKLEALPL